MKSHSCGELRASHLGQKVRLAGWVWSRRDHGGAVFIEVTFSWQGMGSLAVQAVADRDYPVVLAAVILSSTLVVVGGALADLAHAAVNPRQRRA